MIAWSRTGSRKWSRKISRLEGDREGLKKSQVQSLERLFRRRFPRDHVYLPEQAREIALLSRALGRQIGLLIDRAGKVQTVVIGDASSLTIPQLARERSGQGRLRGLRLLHTHLSPQGPDAEDRMDLLFLRLDAIIVLAVDQAGFPVFWEGLRLLPKGGADSAVSVGPFPWNETAQDFAADAEALEEELARLGEGKRKEVSETRALLVSVSDKPRAMQESDLDELEALAATAGVAVAGRFAQRAAPNPRCILGKGKLAELEVAALAGDADTLIFDGELTPAQLHNLADITERKVIDRTQLILDIFARNAKSRAGKLQVELAQLAYSLPRLTGANRALDRLAGGIGGRGPGETRLETDRRKNRERMGRIRRELAAISRQRSLARSRRMRNAVPAAALVGYTNAGKSTLLNRLTNSSTLAEDKLFATLDPATRRLRFPREREIVLADTVGFIRNLPKELLDAFRATLEELEEASLIIHVVDASRRDFTRQMEAVEAILEDLGLARTPRMLVFNKCDLLDAGALEELACAWPDAALVSAADGAGLGEFMMRLERELAAALPDSDLRAQPQS